VEVLQDYSQSPIRLMAAMVDQVVVAVEQQDLEEQGFSQQALLELVMETMVELTQPITHRGVVEVEPGEPQQGQDQKLVELVKSQLLPVRLFIMRVVEVALDIPHPI
jgi:hypothetical protein